MARVLKQRQGLSLAEAILALGLVVVILLATVALAITALRSSQKGSDQVTASTWASKVLEEFVYGVPAATDPFWSSSSYTSPYQTDTVMLGNTEFRSDLFLTDLGATGGGLKAVTVNVSWGSGPQGKTGYGRQVTSVTRLLYAQ